MKKFEFTEETTLGEYLSYWFYTYRANRIRNKTNDDYRLTIFRHINPKIGDIPLSQLTMDVIQNFFNDEAENGNLRYGGPLSPKTLYNMRGLFYSALDKAVLLGYIPRNPVIGIETPVIIKKEMYVLTVEEGNKVRMAALLDEHLDYGFAFWLALSFGLRNGEVCGLKWTDFDFDKLQLTVSRTVTRVEDTDPNSEKRSKMIVSYPKTEKSHRTIPFTETVRDIIFDVKKRRSERNYYCVRNADTDMRAFVMLNKNGNYADTGTVNKNFKRFLKKIGINDPNYTMHSLRHTFVTRGIEKGVDIKTLSEIVGHTSVEFTLNRYGHVLDDHKRKVMEHILEDIQPPSSIKDTEEKKLKKEKGTATTLTSLSNSDILSGIGEE